MYNRAVDEAELARRAVERRAITEEQLREAKSFAEGGRSILSVLLDLGYLRADQLSALLETPAPPPPRPRRWRWVATLFLAGILAFFIGRCEGHHSQSSSGEKLEAENEHLRAVIDQKDREHESARLELSNQYRSLFENLRARGMAGVADGEARLLKSGQLTPEARSRLQQGATLLDVAATVGRLDVHHLTALGRAREYLQEWDPALEAYVEAMKSNSRQLQPFLGAARAALELNRPGDALRYAQASIAQNPTGEAYLLRGRSRLASGFRDAARQDFQKARELDPSLGPVVANLLDRTSRE